MIAARAAFLALLLCFSFAAAADVAVPPLTGRVVDQTGTLSSGDIAALTQTLKDLETRKGSQIAVLIVPTTDQETIEQFSLRVAEAWKIGRKKIDDGALLVVAKNDRRLRIEVGYGLEGALTDATSQAHHRRRHHAEVQVRRFCRRHFRGRRADDPGDRRREASGAGAGALAQPGPFELSSTRSIPSSSSAPSSSAASCAARWAGWSARRRPAALSASWPGCSSARSQSSVIVGIAAFIFALLGEMLPMGGGRGRGGAWSGGGGSWSAAAVQAAAVRATGGFSGGGGSFGGGGASGSW